MSHARRKAPATLDPRGVFVFDTRPLGRQPGAERDESRTVPAPEDLHVGLAGVPAGADIEVAARFESVTEGVLVTGEATAPVVGECARCLDPVASSVTAGFQELYRYAAAPTDDGDADGFVLDGDLLDLEQVVRDAVVLELPLSPLCRDGCPGLCATCGVRLAEASPDHHHDEGHPAWEALRGFDGYSRQDRTDRHAGAGDRQEDD